MKKYKFLNYFINEQCSICGRNLIDIRMIRVDVENDDYVCLRCAKEFNIKVNEPRHTV